MIWQSWRCPKLQWKMFKQISQKSTACSKIVPDKPTHLTTDLLQFWARQLGVLKDIARSCTHLHPDVLANQLHQCTHLMEKKLEFALSGDPEPYHDYIQDFYDNQLQTLREQLNQCKLDLRSRDRTIAEQETNLNYYVSQKQNEAIKGSPNWENFQEHERLKRQLEHCELLLKENSKFMDEQAQIIERLSEQVQQLHESNNQLRKKYEDRVLLFNEEINSARKSFMITSKKLGSFCGEYEQQLRETALVKLKQTEARDKVCRQLQVKTVESRLLTKKIYELESLINKYEKDLNSKEMLIEELSSEANESANYRSFERTREARWKQIVEESKSQILRLGQKSKDLSKENQKMSHQISKLTTTVNEKNQLIETLKKNNAEIEGKNDKNETLAADLESQKQSLKKTIAKLTKEKERFNEELKLMELRSQQLYEQNKNDRESIKRGIMTEVSELVEITQKQQKTIKQLQAELSQKDKELKRCIKESALTENRMSSMNSNLQELTNRLDKIKQENKELRESKGLVEEELSKRQKELEKQDKISKERERKLKQQLEELRDEKSSNLEELNLLKNQIEELEESLQRKIKLESQIMSEVEREQVESHSEKQILKQTVLKKDFEVKQLQTKLKSLQHEATQSCKHHEHEKMRMSAKIKELEQLLNTGFSDSGRL